MPQFTFWQGMFAHFLLAPIQIEKSVRNQLFRLDNALTPRISNSGFLPLPLTRQQFKEFYVLERAVWKKFKQTA